MNQFLIPQFIDIESKIIGPITTRQFLILLVMALFDFIAYKLTDFSLFIIIAVFDLIVFGTIAFFRVNGQPFHYFVLNVAQTLKKPKLRVWKKVVSQAELTEGIKEAKAAAPTRVIPQKLMGTSRLAELALIADTGGIYKGEE
jgi:hypothetical protein